MFEHHPPLFTMLPRHIGFACIVVSGLAWPISAATYYTAVDGNDTNPGTQILPWRTIQKAANALMPGDTVMVGTGSYDERATTVRSGTADTNRIIFQTQGTVDMRGWVINHAYITVRGFDITGHSAASVLDAHVRVNSGGDNFELLNCTVRDGIQVTRSDMVFHSSSNSITSAIGGFLGSRFAPGQTLYVGAATNGLNILNDGTYTINTVSDNSIGVANGLLNEGPLSIYLSASLIYGLYLHSGTENCVIRSNLFRNLSYDTWFIFGHRHVVESNLVEECNGWDAMHFGGTDHVFRRNVIRDSPLFVYQVSPDAMENYPLTPYARVTFTNNFIQGFSGVLASQKGGGHSPEWTLTHNVFVDTGRLVLTHPATVIEHNTFLRVARTNTAVTSIARHPIFVNTSAGGTNIVIRNNVFVDCGQSTGSTPVSQVGWYEISGSASTIITEGNFVAGGPPDFPVKAGWAEGNGLLNGGDPGFENLENPFGPDGIPFSDDDGLRLRPDSKLRGAGIGGADIGAYAFASFAPALAITRLSNDQIRLTWPALADGFELQTASDPAGVWMGADLTPVTEGDTNVVVVSVTNSVRLYRLGKQLQN